MAIKEVCRLCLASDDLLWVFDKHFDCSSDMKNVIHVTTGVEITSKDIVSQKVCSKCCQVTIKMFEFRKTSLKNDQYLKDQCKNFLKEKVIKIPNTQVTIKTEIKKEHISIKNETKSVDGKQENKATYKIHPSVRELFKIYPEIKLPTVCLKYNINPCVSMTLDQVEQYFRSHKLDFHEHTKLALRAGRIATKKTSSILKTKNSIQSKTSVTKNISKSERKEITSKIEDSKETSLLKMKDDRPKLNGGVTSKDKIHSYTNGEESTPSKDKIDSYTEGEENTNSIKNHELSHKVREEHQSKKRKLPEDENMEKKVFKKTNFAESLGLTPKVDPPSGVLSYIANKSLPLHICEICNSVQYSAKDLRRHQNKHLRCQFCKIKLRSLEMKKEHLENSCVIKNVMKNVPDVILQKVELDPSIRIKYPKAFESFSPLPNKINANNAVILENRVNSIERLTKDDFDNKRHVKQIIEIEKEDIGLHKPTPELNPCDVIILSDDDEPLISVSNVVNDDTSSVSCAPQTVPIPTTALPQQDIAHNTTLIPQEDNIVYNTVSIVKPDIKIKGNCALDLIDIRLTDIKVLKELLTNYRPVQLHIEKNIQTDLPSNNSIFLKSDEKNAELRGLKPQLHVFKISIIMKYGAFHVNYNYSLEPKPPKRLRLWNDLTAIDIKPTKIIPYKPTSSDSVTGQNKTILPSTVTYKSTGVVSRPSPPTTSKFIRVNASSLSPVITVGNSLPLANVVTASPAPQHTTPSASKSTTPSIPQFRTPSVPQSTTLSIPQSITPSIPQSTTPSIPQSTTPSIPQSTMPSIPQSPTPSTPQSTVPVSDKEPTTSSAGQQFGTIRVKNLWDLT